MGYYAKDFDVLDNDYIMIIGTEFSDDGKTGYKFRDTHEYSLHLCKQELDAPFIDKELYE